MKMNQKNIILQNYLKFFQIVQKKKLLNTKKKNIYLNLQIKESKNIIIITKKTKPID